MDFVKNYRELKRKNGAQVSKELVRRGLECGDCRTSDEIIWKIVAYDAYHAGRSAGLEEARKEKKNVTLTIEKERLGIVLKDEANDIVAVLKVTKEQKNLLQYLIDEGWLADTSFTIMEQTEWDEP